jgi:ribosome-binding protein aMBF1 (putative translation factor)
MTIHSTSGSSSAAAEPLLRAPMHLDDFRSAALGQIISSRRHERRISRAAFAELVGVREDQVDCIEAGQMGTLSISAAWTVADILGIDLAELFYETRWRAQELAANAGPPRP